MGKSTTCGHEPYKAKGLCNRCYMAAWHDAHPGYVPAPRSTTCGHQPYHGNGLCRACYSADYWDRNREEITARQRLYFEANPERVREQIAWERRNPDYQRQYYAANAEALRESAKAWRRENREYMRQWRREWYKSNAQRMVDQAQAWKRANPERARELARASTRRRRARLFGVDADLTNEQWEAILIEFDFRCAYCNVGDVPMEMEHMTPLSRGGRHTATNVVPACGPCNRSKHTRTALEWVGPDWRPNADHR